MAFLSITTQFQWDMYISPVDNMTVEKIVEDIEYIKSTLAVNHGCYTRTQIGYETTFAYPRLRDLAKRYFELTKTPYGVDADFVKDKILLFCRQKDDKDYHIKYFKDYVGEEEFALIESSFITPVCFLRFYKETIRNLTLSDL